MGIRIDRQPKQRLIFILMMLMLVSLFTSRFLLSLSFLLFLILTCVHKDIKDQLVSFSRSPFLVGMAVLFFIPVLSWFWSEDKQMWLRFARIKLPLLLFPVAFAGDWQLSRRQWQWLARLFLLLVFFACLWSLWQYLPDLRAVHEQYLRAGVMATPLDNDHVRFSLLVALAVLCSVALMKEGGPWNRAQFMIPLGLFFVIYLHILSARTGLAALYIFLLSGLFYWLLMKKDTRAVIFCLLVLVAMPLLAWFLLPTFRNRIRYNVYDLSNAKANHYVPGANDGNRILSLKAGWQVLQEHPFGAGADVVEETGQWYAAHVPTMNPKEILFPSSELLMYAGFAGWVGLFLFVCIMVLPLRERVDRNRYFWIVLNLVMAFSFLFDIGLEAQFGVFIYAFFILWWWKWFRV